MKFMAKTTMNTATFRDMTLGKYQGTLTAAQMNGSNVQNITQKSPGDSAAGDPRPPDPALP